ncbi:hypothetical protein CRYUN_Cryun24cG0082300 [Craigia yunnanensis]
MRYTSMYIENMFSKYTCTVPNKFTLGELWYMIKGNRESFEFFGWIASKLEWRVLYVLARDEEGMLSKCKLRSFLKLRRLSRQFINISLSEPIY